MNEQEKILIQSILAAVSDAPAPDIKNAEAILSLSRYHMVQNIVARVLLEDKSIPDDVRKTLNDEQTLLLIKDANQEAETSSLVEIFEEKHIPVVLLKGWYMKKFYPRSDLRAMADTDIFIRQSDEKKVHEIFVGRDYEVVSFGEKKDNIYKKKPFFIFEMHKNLFVFEDDWNKYFNDEDSLLYIWNRVVKIEGYEYVYRMDDELFFTYMIAHIAKHLLDDGGIGLKSILDVWLFLQKNSDLDLSRVYSDLDKLGLREFSINAILLSEYWFGNKTDVCDKVKRLGDHILGCGVFGNTSVMVATKDEIMSSEKPSRIRYLFKRAFPDFESMMIRFPQLKNKKWLLPYLYIKRLCYSLTRRSRGVKAEINSAKRIDMKQVENIQKLYKDVGLR